MSCVPDATDVPRLPDLRHRVTLARVRVVLFDAGDTLIAFRRPMRILLQDFFIQHNEILKQDRIAEALEAVDPRNRAVMRTIRTVSDERRMWLEIARDLLDVLLPRRRDLYPALARWFADGFMDSCRHLKVFRDVGPTLRRLRARGYRLAVVSNWEPSLPLALDKLRLGKFFDTVVASAIEGVWKPDPKWFEIALQRLGMAPPYALTVGDNLERDIEAAKTVGIRGVLLDRFDSHPEYTPRVKTLTDLLQILDHDTPEISRQDPA